MAEEPKRYGLSLADEISLEGMTRRVLSLPHYERDALVESLRFQPGYFNWSEDATWRWVYLQAVERGYFPAPGVVIDGIDFAKDVPEDERDRIVAGMTYSHPRNVAARQRLELRAALDRPLPPTKTARMLALGHPRTWPSQEGDEP